MKWPTNVLWHSIAVEAFCDTFALAEDYAELNPVVRLLRTLARHHGGGPFYLSARKLAEVIGVGCPKTALQRMQVLAAMKLVELVETGQQKLGGKASLCAGSDLWIKNCTISLGCDSSSTQASMKSLNFEMTSPSSLSNTATRLRRLADRRTEESGT